MLLAAGAVGAAWQDYYVHRDFSSLYHGGRLLTQIDVYDQVAWCREARGTTFGAVDANGFPLCPAVFLYPLWTAVLLLPIGLLPLAAAGSIWLALSIGAAILGARWCWLAAGGSARAVVIFAAIVFAGEPFWLTVAAGQFGGVLLLAVGLGAWLLVRGRERGAGATLALLALKPHVLVFTALALLGRAIARGRIAYVAAAVAAVAALLVVSLPFNVAWPLEWLRETFSRQTGYSPSLATAWGLAAHDLGSVLLAPVLIAAVAAATLWIARGIPSRPVDFSALAVALGLLAAPYAWSYDFLPLALPWAVTIARAERAAPVTRGLLLVSVAIVATLAPWLLYDLAFQRGAETLSALVPALTAIVAATAVRADPDT